jgi:NADP-dependent 3-hydroxy acid dehydrogenase YdfG
LNASQEYILTLKNRSIVVTGGATGIGLGIAKAFVEAGAKVAIGGRRMDAIQAALQSVVAPDRMFGNVLDVSNRKQVAEFFAWSEKTIGETEILVQAAGINIRNRTIGEMNPEDWDRVLAINATGAYNCLHAVLPKMRAKKTGLIINVSSIAGKRAISLGGVAYCASKFAMTAMGTCVSNEVGNEGIRITNIYPGEVNTPLLDQRPVAVSEEHKSKILQPEDVAAMVIALASLPPQAHVPEMIIKPVTQMYY